MNILASKTDYKVSLKCAIKVIPNLSLLNNFEFSPDGLRVWKAYNIGSGE